MDSKIKLKVESLKWIVISLIAITFLPGCKQDEWTDWRLQNDIWLELNKAKDVGVEQGER